VQNKKYKTKQALVPQATNHEIKHVFSKRQILFIHM